MEGLPLYFTGLLAILLLTSFVKMVTTLSILRYGIGLHGAGFGLVIVALALALSLVVMYPQVEASGGVGPFLNTASSGQVLQLENKYRPFVERHADPRIVERLSRFAGKAAEPAKTEVKKEKEHPFPVLIAAFLISELREAFQLGFLFIVPFLIIDLLVTNVLMALGVTQISQAVAALPLKILLFFAVDGWALVSERLIGGYV